VKATLVEMDKKLDSLIQSFNVFQETVCKHEIALYGKEGTEAVGIIRKVDGIGSKLDYLQRFALFIWTGIFTAIQGVVAVISYFRHRT
jgi:hypothetical protein